MIEFQISVALIVTIIVLAVLGARAVRQRRESPDGRTISPDLVRRLTIAGGAAVAVVIGFIVLWPTFR